MSQSFKVKGEKRNILVLNTGSGVTFRFFMRVLYIFTLPDSMVKFAENRIGKLFFGIVTL